MSTSKTLLAGAIASALVLCANVGVAQAHIGTKLSLQSAELSSCGADQKCNSHRSKAGFWILIASLGAFGAGVWQAFDNPVSR